MSIESVMPSNHLILCRPLLLPSVFPNIRVFSSESALCIRWPKYWSFSFSTSPSNKYSGLISFRIDWLDLLAVQGTLQESSLAPQFESINSSVLSLLYGPTLTSIHDSEKSKALTIWTIVKSTLDSKEIQLVHPEGNQSWIFIGRTDAEAPILWPPDVKTWLTGKHPDAGKDCR